MWQIILFEMNAVWNSGKTFEQNIVDGHSICVRWCACASACASACACACEFLWIESMH